MDKNHCAKCIHLKKVKRYREELRFMVYSLECMCVMLVVDSGLLVQSLILIYVSISQKTNLK